MSNETSIAADANGAPAEDPFLEYVRNWRPNSQYEDIVWDACDAFIAAMGPGIATVLNDPRFSRLGDQQWHEAWEEASGLRLDAYVTEDRDEPYSKGDDIRRMKAVVYGE